MTGRGVAVLGYALVDGFTEVERPLALARLKDAVAAAHGFIVDIGFYPDEAMRVSVELQAGALPALRDALEERDVHLFEKSAAAIDELYGTRPHKPLLAMLHVARVRKRDRDALTRARPR